MAPALTPKSPRHTTHSATRPRPPTPSRQRAGPHIAHPFGATTNRPGELQSTLARRPSPIAPNRRHSSPGKPLPSRKLSHSEPDQTSPTGQRAPTAPGTPPTRSDPTARNLSDPLPRLWTRLSAGSHPARRGHGGRPARPSPGDSRTLRRHMPGPTNRTRQGAEADPEGSSADPLQSAPMARRAPRKRSPTGPARIPADAGSRS